MHKKSYALMRSFSFRMVVFIMFAHCRNLNTQVCAQRDREIRYFLKIISLSLLLLFSTFSSSSDIRLNFNLGGEDYHYDCNSFYDCPIISIMLMSSGMAMAALGLITAGVIMVGTSLVAIPIFLIGSVVSIVASINALVWALRYPIIAIGVPIGIILSYGL